MEEPLTVNRMARVNSDAGENGRSDLDEEVPEPLELPVGFARNLKGVIECLAYPWRCSVELFVAGGYRWRIAHCRTGHVRYSVQVFGSEQQALEGLVVEMKLL
jgi:hypothetical protein